MIIKKFRRDQMEDHDPEYRDTVAYLDVGTVVLADRVATGGNGWQRVIIYTSGGPETIKHVWIHPAVLGRFALPVEVLDSRMVNARRWDSDRHIVNVLSMDGKIDHMRDHTGLCERILRVKLYNGNLLKRVLDGLASLRDHSVISFGCEHGKHRSVAARTVLLALCPLVTASSSGKDVRECYAGCAPMSPESIRNLIQEFLGLVQWL